jgi:hypothetical protein
MDKWLGTIIGVIFGLILIVIGIATPSFLWNWDAVSSIRFTVGDTITRIALIVGGIAILGGALLKHPRG